MAETFYVQSKIPEGRLCLLSWQKNPGTADGSFVPTSWNVGEKTGLEITENRLDQQLGMGTSPGSTTAQVCGNAVGAYLNSKDLSVEGLDADGQPLPGSPGYKMMVTPEIKFPSKNPIRPFEKPGARLLLSFDLQVPVANDQKKNGSHSYVNPCFVFTDPTTKLKLSYIVATFSNGYRLTKADIRYDEPSHSWMLHTSMAPGQKWLVLEPGSEVFQSTPWTGWKHFAFAITTENMLSALREFSHQKPELPCSTNPGDYVLSSYHLNAEFNFRTAPAELGWSMREAMISLESPAASPQ